MRGQDGADVAPRDHGERPNRAFSSLLRLDLAHGGRVPSAVRTFLPFLAKRRTVRAATLAAVQTKKCPRSIRRSRS